MHFYVKIVIIIKITMIQMKYFVNTYLRELIPVKDQRHQMFKDNLL